MKIFLFDTSLLDSMDETLWIDLLDKERKQKITKIKNKKDRFQSIGAGLLLRYVYMNFYHECEEWENVVIKRNAMGKPFIDGNDNLHFSLTHSGSFAGICMENSECGIDLQEMKPVRMRLAERFFAEEEYEMLCRQQEENVRIKNFYKYWTAKESFVKYKGIGLSDGIDRFVVDMENSCVCDRKTQDTGYIDFAVEDEKYMLCVCSREKIREIDKNIITLTVQQLLEGCYAKCNWEECGKKG